MLMDGDLQSCNVLQYKKFHLEQKKIFAFIQFWIG